MKKFLGFIFAFVLMTSVFATSYKVVNITGKVFVNNAQVEIEQVLDDEDVLNVRPQAAITLQPIDKIEKRTFKTANNHITVKDAWVQSAIGKGGLKKMKIADASHIAPPVDRPREAVATAASRASEAKEDFEWDE
jgi:repressor of nif and glnA expression